MSMITEQIKSLREAYKLLSEYGRCETYLSLTVKEAISTIEDLSAKLANANMERSTAYYKDGWIPVSERLPEKCEWYLVTYKFHDMPKATCHELYYGDEYGYKQRWYLDDEYTELDAPFDVIAWRELPAPYQPKGDKE